MPLQNPPSEKVISLTPRSFGCEEVDQWMVLELERGIRTFGVISASPRELSDSSAVNLCLTFHEAEKKSTSLRWFDSARQLLGPVA